jgi:hypothetical protein
LPRPYKGTWVATARVRQRIVELYADGWDAKHIGDEVGLTTSTVFYHLRVAKVKRRGRHRRKGKLGYVSHKQMDKTIELYQSGLTLRETGAVLGISHATVRYRLMNAGVPLRAAHKNNREQT